MAAKWRVSRNNLIELVFPDVDNIECAITEFEACMSTLMGSDMGVADGYDVQRIYVLEETARKRLGCDLYRWKPSKTNSEGFLICPEVRVFFTYLYGRIIVLTPTVRTGFTYSRDEIYAFINEGVAWKKRIEQFNKTQGGL